jgi:hypothetical protein
MRRTLVVLVAALCVGVVGRYDPAGTSDLSSDDPAVERSYEATGDLDCADVTYDEAQALIDSGDPHGLDRDSDGEACESNR